MNFLLMFTGIIEATAQVLEGSQSDLIIERPSLFDDIAIGSSICVSGVCLTIVGSDAKTMTFNLHPETCKRTTLGNLREGDRANLERALKLGDRFGGHIVQGHVDAVGTVKQSDVRDDRVLLIITYPARLCGNIVAQGSIAVDGVSLTVVSVTDEEFSVALVPHTLEETTLGHLNEGDAVNLEAEILAKYVRDLSFCKCP